MLKCRQLKTLAIHGTNELYILTRMETRQLFRRMFAMLKKFKELVYPT